ncbi:MAG: phenylacetate-CoA oxygenase subunit PaaJ [Actinomycetota bacterium]|nr:phenylacetate-CoA oxygenase subunit PaaJ [Actinomycetota bacterium]
MVTKTSGRAPLEIELAVWDALGTVADPEIPAVSVVEMGMIERVQVDGDRAKVVVLPTFTGCPAIAIIQEDVRRAAASVEGVGSVEVETSFDPPWTSDRISGAGRERLREFGLAPPTGGRVVLAQIGLPKVATCPFCGSTETRNDSLFGPTPCRAAYYCTSCRNPFEQFKQV